MRITKEECQWVIEPSRICQNSGLLCEKHKNCMIKRKLKAIRTIRNFRPSILAKEEEK